MVVSTLPAPGGSGFARRTEGDRVTQFLRRRDAVLPAPARLVAQDIRRARLQLKRENLFAPFRFPRIRTEADARCTAQRDADDQLEVRNVAVPTERRTWRVLRDQRLHEILRCNTGPLRSTRAQRCEKFRNRRRGVRLLMREVVREPV